MHKHVWVVRVKWLTPGDGVTFMVHPTREKAREHKRSMAKSLGMVTRCSLHKAYIKDGGILISTEVQY